MPVGPLAGSGWAPFWWGAYASSMGRLPAGRLIARDMSTWNVCVYPVREHFVSHAPVVGPPNDVSRVRPFLSVSRTLGGAGRSPAAFEDAVKYPFLRSVSSLLRARGLCVSGPCGRLRLLVVRYDGVGALAACCFSNFSMRSGEAGPVSAG